METTERAPEGRRVQIFEVSFHALGQAMNLPDGAEIIDAQCDIYDRGRGLIAFKIESPAFDLVPSGLHVRKDEIIYETVEILAGTFGQYVRRINTFQTFRSMRDEVADLSKDHLPPPIAHGPPDPLP